MRTADQTVVMRTADLTGPCAKTSLQEPCAILIGGRAPDRPYMHRARDGFGGSFRRSVATAGAQGACNTCVAEHCCELGCCTVPCEVSCVSGLRMRWPGRPLGVQKRTLGASVRARGAARQKPFLITQVSPR